MMSGSMEQPVLLQPHLNQQRQQQQQLGQSRTSSGEMSIFYVNSGDDSPGQRDIVWPKLQMLRSMYLQDLEQLYKFMTTSDSRALSADHVLKLNHYMEIVRRMITYLRVTQENMPLGFTDQMLDRFAQQIGMVIDIFKRKSDAEKARPGTNSSSGVS